MSIFPLFRAFYYNIGIYIYPTNPEEGNLFIRTKIKVNLMLEVCALASGSSGNCFYVSDSKNSVLIDTGISCKQIEKRLNKVNKKAEDIDALFVTHEHGDHTAGVDVFARRYEVPVYATKKTIEKRMFCKNEDLIHQIKRKTRMNIGDLEIESFPKFHDAVDPVSFNVINSRKVSIMTDLGKICKNVEKNISDSHALFIESNYDKEMLKNGPYPLFLKRRIAGTGGHISNKEASESVLRNVSEKLEHLILCHLSENNNTYEKALSSFGILNEKKYVNPKISISGRYEPTELFKV